MNTLPRPALGMKILMKTGADKEERIWEVSEIDRFKQTFTIREFAQQHPLVISGLSLLSSYKPFPNRANFERALEEWDYYYQQSDDMRRFEEGAAQKRELFEMFKQLTPADKLHYQKIHAVVFAV